MMEEPKLNWTRTASFGCMGLSLASYSVAGLAFLSARTFHAPQLAAIPIALLIGFWAAPVGIVFAASGMIVTRDRKRVYLAPLGLNLVIGLASLGVLTIATILIRGH